MVLNDFIDYNVLFNKALEEAREGGMFNDFNVILMPHDNDLDEDQKLYKALYEFRMIRKRPSLVLDECRIEDDVIEFVFGEDGIDANESDTQGSFYYYVFYYSLSDECFTMFEYEQG
jgi:hypothetical protein